MQKLLSPRVIFVLVGFACLGLLATAWYLQHGPDRQQPCPLCVLQRYTYVALAIVSLVAAAYSPQRLGMLASVFLAELFAATGAALALWQVTKGASMVSCLADPIGEFVNALPSANWWPAYLFANGGCADRYPPIFGLYVPQWSLVWSVIFIGLITVALIATLRSRHTS